MPNGPERSAVARSPTEPRRTCPAEQQWAQRRDEMRRTVQRVQDMKIWQVEGG